MRSKKRYSCKQGAPALPLYIFTGIFILIPLLYTVFLSFMTRTDSWAVEYRFTLENYKGLLEHTVLSTFGKSLKMGFLVTVITVLLGYPTGLALASLPEKQQKLCYGAMTFTFWINSVVRIYGIVILLRTDGLFGSMRLLYSYGGVIAAMVYALLPFMIYAVYSGAAGLDPSPLEAARVLGADRFRTFLDITLPRTARGLLSGVTMTFIPSMGLIYISSLVGGGKVLVVGNLIEDQVMKIRNIPFSAALAVALMLLTASVILLCNFLDPVRRRRRHSGKVKRITGQKNAPAFFVRKETAPLSATDALFSAPADIPRNFTLSETYRENLPSEKTECGKYPDRDLNGPEKDTARKTTDSKGSGSVSAFGLKQKKGQRIASMVPVCILLLFLYLPIAVAVIFSFNDSRSSTVWSGFSFRWYETLFSDSAMTEALFHSVVLALLSGLIASVVATAAALAFKKHRIPLAREVTGVSMIPIMIPDVILGMVFLAYFNSLHLPFGFLTLLIAHTAFCIPYCYLQISTCTAAMDPSPSDAARVLGAGPVRTFFEVTMPELLPGILSGLFISFAMSFDDVIISMFVTGSDFNTLPIRVYTQVKTGVTPEINALCSIMLLFALVCVLLSGLYRRKHKV